MALLFVHELSSDTKIGVWKIEEDKEQILSLYPHLLPITNRYQHPVRQLEKLAAYLLLYSLQPCRTLMIDHNEQGRPLLSNGQTISVSDTRGYVAMILSRKRVGVDIEYVSDRVDKIFHRFIRPDEDSSTSAARLLNWSVKETVYKYYSEQNLGFFDMRLIPGGDDADRKSMDACEVGTVDVENMREGEVVRVRYLLNASFVLTYTFQ